MGEGGIKSVLRLFLSYNYFSFIKFEAMVTDQLIKKNIHSQCCICRFSKDTADTTGSHIGEFECRIRQSAPINSKRASRNNRN